MLRNIVIVLVLITPGSFLLIGLLLGLYAVLKYLLKFKVEEK